MEFTKSISVFSGLLFGVGGFRFSLARKHGVGALKDGSFKLGAFYGVEVDRSLTHEWSIVFFWVLEMEVCYDLLRIRFWVWFPPVWSLSYVEPRNITSFSVLLDLSLKTSETSLCLMSLVEEYLILRDRSKDVGEIKAKVAYFDEGYLTSGEDADVEETGKEGKEAKEDTEDFSFEDYVAADHPMAMDALRFMASLFDDFLLQGLVSLRPVGIFSPTKAVREMGFLLIFVEYVKTKSPDLDGGDLGLKEKSDKRVPKLEAGQKEEDTVISEMNERIAPPGRRRRGISNNIVEKEVDEEEEAIGASRNKGNIETGVAVQAKSNTEVGDEWSFTRLCAVWYRSAVDPAVCPSCRRRVVATRLWASSEHWDSLLSVGLLFLVGFQTYGKWRGF
ncbi:hypothetical protein U1Q18_040460 [Sarracenia purpurea var. burkii]